MGCDRSRTAAVSNVASEDVVIVIGVDADGALRPAYYVNGKLGAVYATQPRDFITRPSGLQALVAEAIRDAAALQAAKHQGAVTA